MTPFETYQKLCVLRRKLRLYDEVRKSDEAEQFARLTNQKFDEATSELLQHLNDLADMGIEAEIADFLKDRYSSDS